MRSIELLAPLLRELRGRIDVHVSPVYRPRAQTREDVVHDKALRALLEALLAELQHERPDVVGVEVARLQERQCSCLRLHPSPRRFRGAPEATC